MIEILQNIIINGLFKNCDQDEKFEKEKHKLALHYFIDEVLFISSTIKVLWHVVTILRSLDFSLEFDDVLWTDIVKIYNCFTLFFNIINYWCGVT